MGLEVKPRWRLWGSTRAHLAPRQPQPLSSRGCLWHSPVPGSLGTSEPALPLGLAAEPRCRLCFGARPGPVPGLRAEPEPAFGATDRARPGRAQRGTAGAAPAPAEPGDPRPVPGEAAPLGTAAGTGRGGTAGPGRESPLGRERPPRAGARQRRARERDSGTGNGTGNGTREGQERDREGDQGGAEVGQRQTREGQK